MRVGLGPEVVQPWDGWLQDGLHTLAETLGERWEVCYMSAPVWRFTLPPDVVGPSGLRGVMMPSVDRVGRKFPLTLAGATTEMGLASHLAADGIFGELEDLVLSALEDDMTVEALKEGLGQIGEGPVPVVSRVESAAGSALRVSGDGVTAAVLAAHVSPPNDDKTIWSAHMEGDCRLFTCAGLPDAEGLLALFDLDAALWQEAAA